MRSVMLTALALVLAGCTAAVSTLAPTPTPPPAPTLRPAPTPTPLINFDEMMGMYPQQTVFVATSDHLSAVTLLNHFTRYNLATNGVAQATADAAGRSLYVLDNDTPPLRRLRRFDVASGEQRASVSGIGDVVDGAHTLGVAGDGRVLVLKSNAGQIWVDGYAVNTLQPLGAAVPPARGCADRLVTSPARVAIVCSPTGEAIVDNLRGTHVAVDGAMPDITAAAIGANGTLYLARADAHVGSVAASGSKLIEVAWPREWAETVVPDSLALVAGGTALIMVQTDGDAAMVRLLPTVAGVDRKSFRLAGVPRAGILALWPFAYYAIGSTIRHVDLLSGLLETMTEVGDGAAPVAIVNG